MNWLTNLFYKNSPAKDVFDKNDGLLVRAGEWFGNQKFTAEESAELNAKTAEGVRKFVIESLNESTDRSKSRRAIAVFFIKFYGLMLFMCGMTYPLDIGWSRIWFDMATSLSVGGLVTSISIFYFGSHGVSRIMQDRER